MREVLARQAPDARHRRSSASTIATERAAVESLVAAASAAALSRCRRSSREQEAAGRATLELRLFGAALPPRSRRRRSAQAFGNNVARWFTALPPNVLTMATYRRAIEALAKPRGIACRFLGERELEKLGAGAFLAVARGNATRDAGIVHLRYRPGRSAAPRASRSSAKA